MYKIQDVQDIYDTQDRLNLMFLAAYRVLYTAVIPTVVRG